MDSRRDSDFEEMEFNSTYMDDIQVVLNKLRKVWDEVGFSPKERQARMSSLMDTVRLFLTSEERYKDNLLKAIEDKGQELLRLSKALGVYHCEDFSDQNCLIDTDRSISKTLATLRLEVQKRTQELDKLYREEKELCEQLIEDPSVPCTKEVPSLDDIEDVKRRINTLVQEKKHRTRTFRNLKTEIVSLLQELEQPVNSSFQHSIVSGDEQLFTMSLHNLDAMKRLKSNLITKVNENRREIKRLEEDVRQLWSRLEVEEQERRTVLDRLTESVPRNIEIYRVELERLEVLKRENIEKLITNLRAELHQLWDDCYVGEEERSRCRVYHSSDCYEETLEELELAVEQLKKRREEAAHIYAKLDYRKKLWDKIFELDEKKNDPSRLFKNRGCALLQEERERNRVRGKLPCVEAELMDAVKEWEEGHDGQPFLAMGLSVKDYVNNQWSDYVEKKHTMAKERQTARAAQLEEEARLGTRRKASNNTTLRRNFSQVAATARRIPLGVVARRTVNSPGMSRTGRRSPRVRAAQNASETILSTYSQFADNIAARSEQEQIRSSMMVSPSFATPQPMRPRLAVIKSSPFKTPHASTPRQRPVPATLPRSHRPAAALPRVALLTTPSRASPRNSGVERTLSISIRPDIGRKSPASRGISVGLSVPRTMPRRRSSRLQQNASISRCKLSTPSRNRLQFLM